MKLSLENQGLGQNVRKPKVQMSETEMYRCCPKWPKSASDIWISDILVLYILPYHRKLLVGVFHNIFLQTATLRHPISITYEAHDAL
jgi:hypothetical protein